MTPDEFLRELALDLGNMGIDHLQGKIPSKTLTDALTVIVDGPGLSRIYIPHFWALYVHDGRQRPIYPINGRFLVWFKNHRDDPRLPGGEYPIRANDVRSLTKEEFKEAKSKNEIIVAKSVKKTVAPSYFFLNSVGMKGFEERVNNKVKIEMDKYVEQTLREAKIWSIKEELRLFL